jgi:hypothetical protein
MKTAVEFLLEELQLDVFANDEEMATIIKAKEMEKEQNIDFARKCLEKAKDLDVLTAFLNTEHYYNETFKQQEQ